MVRAGARAALERDSGFAIVGEPKTGRSLQQMLDRTDPEVVLLDQEMSGIDAFAFLDRMRHRDRAPGIVLLSEQANPEHVQAAFSRGAIGYVLKRIDPLDLPAAIRQAFHGTAYHARGLPAISENAAARAAGLTDREFDVVKAVARGLSNSAVGEELKVTEQTVKFHLTNVYRKLGVDNRTAAVRWAVSRGLV
jgi:DNA-binding NarL/FixJ family response regulator